MSNILEEKKYLDYKLSEYRSKLGNDNIPIRLISSYFNIDYNNLGNKEVKIYVNTFNSLSIRVSDDFSKELQSAYYLFLLPVALIYQKNNTILPKSGSVIFDINNHHLSKEQIELYKQFGKELIKKERIGDVKIVR